MSNLDKYRKNLQDEENQRNSNSLFPVEKSIKAGVANVLRIVDPESTVEYWEAWMLCDDDKVRPFIVENDFQGESVLSKILGDKKDYYRGGILSSKVDESKTKYYEYESVDPELLLHVAYNNDKSGDSGSWKPTRRYPWNVIDREPEEEGDLKGQNWCAVKKHTKLFKVGSQGFLGLMDTRDNDGPLDAYDINYKKTGTGKNATKHSAQKAGPNLQNPYVIYAPLSAEELAYERYDLKKVGALTTAKEMLKHLRQTITRISQVLGVDFIQQLESQAILEANASAEAPLTPAPQVAPVAQKQDAPTPQAPVSQTAVLPTTSVRRAASPEKQSGPEKVVCPICQKMTVEQLNCEHCQGIIMEPCDNIKCKVPFLITKDTCPACGKKYSMVSK